MTTPVSTFSYADNLLEKAAERIIDKNLERLPDLSHCVALIPTYNAASNLRQLILKYAKQKGFNSLIGPRVFLVRDYILKNTLVSNKQLSDIASELLIVQSLKDNPSLFGSNNVLSSAYALLEVIQELTRHQIVLPSNFSAFKQQLENAYKTNSDRFEALGHEAKLIFSIWQAWHEQLSSLNAVDKESLYQIKLGQNHEQSLDDEFYLIGNQHFLKSEIRWMQKKLEAEKIHVLLTCESKNTNIHPDAFGSNLLKHFRMPHTFTQSETPKDRFLNLIYEQNNQKLIDKVETIKHAFSQSPVMQNISILQANKFEEEAKAIQIQIRLWLNEGLKDIAFVSEDRRLARRVRALLERHGIGLHDNEGWALSTSSTASIVENLLEAIEENFNHTAILHLLKSHFIFPQTADTIKAIQRLEHEVIPFEKVYSDIDRYKKAIIARQKRLQIAEDETNSHLSKMLEKLKKVTQNILQLYETGNHSASNYCSTLRQCLNSLMHDDSFANDIAGKEIYSLLDQISLSNEKVEAHLNWTEFRQWFAKKLEDATFTVDTPFKTQVRYLHLSQTNLLHFDAIVIGNCSREHFPGNPKKTPFFNQQVFQELGLSNANQQLQENFFYYRRLLSAANKICLTFHSGEEERQLSPWVEILENIHTLSFENTLQDDQLLRYATAPLKTMAVPQTRASAKINRDLLPKRISASAHQALVNCPYTFFLSDVLKLRAPEEIRLTLAKSDYGERIHFILFLFHQGGNRHYPAPFMDPITEQNKAIAIERLTEISNKVFQQDLEDNFVHRGWLHRWLAIIPKYINWQIKEQVDWHFSKGEIADAMPLTPLVEAFGRIDRIDTGPKGARIIDYKTGNFPHKNDVESGESVQLSHYAIASKTPVNELAYLSMDSKTDQLKTATILNEDNLEFTRSGVEQRLQTMLSELEKGAKLPAWGDDTVCHYCQFSGICRQRLD